MKNGTIVKWVLRHFAVKINNFLFKLRVGTMAMKLAWYLCSQFAKASFWASFFFRFRNQPATQINVDSQERQINKKHQFDKLRERNVGMPSRIARRYANCKSVKKSNAPEPAATIPKISGGSDSSHLLRKIATKMRNKVIPAQIIIHLENMKASFIDTKGSQKLEFNPAYIYPAHLWDQIFLHFGT